MTETLSSEAENIIESYLNLPIGPGISCPYYVNKKNKVRAALRSKIGKGTPIEIVDEANILAAEKGVDLKKISSNEAKKFLYENNIGVDCSGLAYHVFDAESKSLGKGSISSHLFWPGNFWRKILAKVRPAENASVVVFSHLKNSRIINLANAKVGDFIAAISENGEDRNHILIIERLEKENDAIKNIGYIHSIAWPSDGLYEHGVRRGEIKILDIKLPLFKQSWTELGKNGAENYTFKKMSGAKLSNLYRFSWL